MHNNKIHRSDQEGAKHKWDFGYDDGQIVIYDAAKRLAFEAEWSYLHSIPFVTPEEWEIWEDKNPQI
jgi:hypothetical protein